MTGRRPGRPSFDDAPFIEHVARIMAAAPGTSKEEAYRQATRHLPAPQRGATVERLRKAKKEIAAAEGSVKTGVHHAGELIAAGNASDALSSGFAFIYDGRVYAGAVLPSILGAGQPAEPSLAPKVRRKLASEASAGDLAAVLRAVADDLDSGRVAPSAALRDAIADLAGLAQEGMEET